MGPFEPHFTLNFPKLKQTKRTPPNNKMRKEELGDVRCPKVLNTTTKTMTPLEVRKEKQETNIKNQAKNKNKQDNNDRPKPKPEATQTATLSPYYVAWFGISKRRPHSMGQTLSRNMWPGFRSLCLSVHMYVSLFCFVGVRAVGVTRCVFFICFYVYVSVSVSMYVFTWVCMWICALDLLWCPSFWRCRFTLMANKLLGCSFFKTNTVKIGVSKKTSLPILSSKCQVFALFAFGSCMFKLQSPSIASPQNWNIEFKILSN